MKTYLTYRYALVFLFLLSLNSYTQERSHYALLWKIESKTHQKPSYLFGTMHINDARAFNFSDAVLPAIKNCEKFALEIQPDSIALKITTKKSDKKAYLTYKKILSSEEFKQISDRFFLVNGYSIEESTQSDPNVLISMLHPDRNEIEHKKTFVDMHLLGHAKTMQKQIIGLENIEDQIGHFDKLSQEEQRKYILQEVKFDINTYNKQLEILTKVYLTGDINEINKMMTSYDGYDDELKSRNKVMCQSIIREMENSSIFSAVGAAHLPGSMGLIKMLRDKGYKVTAVEANFTGVANTFKIDPLEMKWKKFTDTKMGYSVETPGMVSTDSSYVDFNLNSYSDIISKKYYTFFTLDLRKQITENTKEQFYERIITNTSNKYDAKILSRKKVIIDNVSGYELVMQQNTVKKDSPFTGIRSIYLINNGIFYQFFVLDDIKVIQNTAISRFFNSVKFSEPKPEKVNQWHYYYNEKGAFSVNLPSVPQDSSQEIQNPYEEDGEAYKLNLYLSSDITNGNNYLIRYNDLPKGYHIDNLEESFALIKESLIAKSNALLSSKKISLNGYEGREYELVLHNDYHAICRVYLRGNRTYLLLSQKINNDEKTDPNNDFLESFKFENFTNQERLISHSTNDFEFKTLTESRILKDSLSFSETYYKNTSGYFSKNTENGDFYSFEFSELKPFFKINNIDNFYKISKENLMSWNDSITEEHKIKIGDSEALEFFKINKKDNLKSRHVLWLDNNYFFLSTAVTSKETINSSLTDSILKSYRSLSKRKTIDYFSSKIDRIVNDLESKDSKVFNNALGALSYYKFEENDLKTLYKTVDLEYTNEEHKALVIDAVLNVLRETNTITTLDFLTSLYLKPGLSENSKRTILYTIPTLKNDNRLAVYSNLLLNHAPKESDKHDYNLFLPFKDSVKFAIANYKPLIKLRDRKEFRRNILEISSLILKSDDQNSMSILSHINDVNEYASKDLEAYLQMQKKEDYDYTQHSLIDSYLALFYNIPNTTNDSYINSFTKKLLLQNTNKWITYNALKGRLKHHLKIDSSTINHYLDSLETRFSLLKAYHDLKKLKEVSNTYLKPEKFSKLSLNEFLNYNDEYPKATKLLKKITRNDKLYYAYSMIYENSNPKKEDQSYLAVVGPCKKIKQQNAFKRYKVHTNWELIEENWEKQVLDLLPN